MINLLPPELKEAYLYANNNVRMIRWVTACAIGIVGLTLLSTAGLIYVHQATAEYAKQVTAKQNTLQNQRQTSTQNQVKDISSSLKLAVHVLSKEILFSKLITHLATITPSNAVLTNLNIAQDSSTVDVTALTTDYTAATQLQINLADPANALFSKADILTIVCGNLSGGHYPCTVTIRALFVTTTNNPYLFINDGKLAKP
jgi:hypothetical protein